MSSSSAVSDDTIKAEIHRALYNIKVGNFYVLSGLEEEDLERVQKGEDEAVNLFFVFVARQLGERLSPQKKKRATKTVLEVLKSRREVWMKQIQQYNGEPAVDKEDSEGDMKESDNVMMMDVDEESKQETHTPRKPKAESSGESAVVTSSTQAGDKKEPADMDVEEPVKVERQKSKTDETDDSPSAGADGKKEFVDVDMEEVGKEKLPGEDVKPESTADECKKKPATDAKEVAEKQSGKPPKSSKKRKADSKEDKKASRKKSRGKTAESVKKKKTFNKSRKKKAGFAAQLEATREKAKKEFEEEKAEILAELSEEYKSLWGQVGYAKWAKTWLPCLFLSPFDVNPLTTMRDNWMRMYENVCVLVLAQLAFIALHRRTQPSFSLLFLTDQRTQTPKDAHGLLVRGVGHWQLLRLLS